MKLCVVGGGSSYTPELLRGIIDEFATLGINDVVLTDPRQDRLGPVSAFCRKMVDAAGVPICVTTETDLDKALVGADFVVVQIRVGGQEGRHEDIQLGLRHGLIGQETTGVGGFAKAIRTVPVVLEIARRIEAIAPNAWMLNFTNPAGLVTEAVLNHVRERCVGLCNVPIEMQMDLAEILGAKADEVTLDWVGLNHLGWVRRVDLRGKDMLPELLEQIEDGVPGPANVPEIDYPPGFLKSLGAIPSSYVRFFYMPDEMLAEIQAAKLTRAQEVAVIEEELLKIYADPESPPELPALLSQRGGAWYSRLAVQVLGALASDEPTVHIVNTRNDGVIPGITYEASVEVPCHISKHGVVPIPRGDVDDAILGLMQQVKSYERLTIRAAVEKSPRLGMLALLANPLVPDAKVATAVMSDCVERGLLE
ncbi:MAG: 6-phospho-beta-glucosidase [Bradymonadia bacterium]|jgi:6-phospho-beta-glucosidase